MFNSRTSLDALLRELEISQVVLRVNGDRDLERSGEQAKRLELALSRYTRDLQRCLKLRRVREVVATTPAETAVA